MKILKNKYVVGVLGVGAIVIVANNLGAFKSSEKVRPATDNSDQANVIKKSPSNKSAATHSPFVLSNQTERVDLPMDISLIKRRISQWVQAPGRDPFQYFNKQPDYPGAATKLKLSAVWRQTTSRLVVINQKVLAEGDVIEEYRIERIERDRVWVHGPIGQEPLDLELALTEARQDPKKVKLIAKQKR